MKIHKGIEDLSGINKPILTVGTFDGVHIGHQKIISRIGEVAKKEGGESVLLTFHPHPRMVLFPDDDSLKLINTIDEKSDLLESFGLDHVIYLPFKKEFSRMSPVEYVRDVLVNKIGIDTIVIGYDHQFGRNRQGNLDLLKELGPAYEFNVEEIPAQEVDAITISSTKVRKAILNGEVAIANEYLGHQFSMTGEVVEGKKLGRELGYPTANMQVQDKHKIVPGSGVYSVTGVIEGKKYQGMLNIGFNPTVDDSREIKIEVHFFGLSEDLYGKKIPITFYTKIREEKKFDSLNSLKKQLTKDETSAKQYFQKKAANL